MEDLIQWASLVVLKVLTKENIQNGFRASRIWPRNRATMSQNTRLCEPFVFHRQDNQVRKKIFEEGISKIYKDLILYYDKGHDLEDNQLHEEELEQGESPTSAHLREDSINKFLKLLRVSRKAIREGRIEPLVDYFQSQLLTSS